MVISDSEHGVDFLGHKINCIQDADGTPYVPLKWLCEILGIDPDGQRRSVKGRGIYEWKMLSVKGTDGRHRKMLCLPQKQLCFWSYIVNANTVRPEIRERLLEYQQESTTALRHTRQYGLALNPRRPAEEIEGDVRESLDSTMRETFRDRHDPQQMRFELLARELVLFSQFDNEAPPYRDKARECKGAAIKRYEEWLHNAEKDTLPGAKSSEKMDELRSLEKDYRDLHSVKDDLFELCNRLIDREPKLCDQLWQFCCRVHERCEAILSLILDLKEDLGCRYYWEDIARPSVIIKQISTGGGR
jgi:hypothetical protein